jgi:hypothetical protein
MPSRPSPTNHLTEARGKPLNSPVPEIYQIEGSGTRSAKAYHRGHGGFTETTEKTLRLTAPFAKALRAGRRRERRENNAKS